MRLGVCAGFGEPVGAAFPFMESIGIQLVRQEVSIGMSDEIIRALLQEFAGVRLQLLLLLHGGKMTTSDGSGRNRRVEPHEYAELGRRVVRLASALGLSEFAVEVGNEPDIAHVDYKVDPNGFAAAVRQTYDGVRAEGFRGAVISGGISNLMRTPRVWWAPWKREDPKRGIDYLQAALASGTIPSDVIVGVHRYPVRDDQRTPQAGFSSRVAEVEALRNMLAGRSFAVTECGAHDFRQSQQEQGDAINYELEFWEKQGALYTVLYQLNDAPTRTSYEDCWGLRGGDGTPKAAASMLRERAQQNATSHHES